MPRPTKKDIHKLSKTKVGFVFYKSLYMNAYQIPILEDLVKEKKVFAFYEDNSTVVFKECKK